MIFDIPHKPKYRVAIEFNTTIAQKVKAHEQRHCRWLNPKLTFDLKFSNIPENTVALEDFFVAQKGDYELFYWNWDVTGLDYKCFFEGDKLSQDLLEQGYSDTSLTLVTVDDGNVLKNRFLTTSKHWEIFGNANIVGGEFIVTDVANISQRDMLNVGDDYVLEVFCENLSGSVPVLSSVSASNTLEERSLGSGVNMLEFTAASGDLVLEVPDGTSCGFYDFLVYKKYAHQARLSLPAKAERTKEVMFRTLSDEKFTYQNNRRAMWDEPLSRWVLTFDLTPEATLELMGFFISQKGRYKSFLWNDGAQDYTVRFDDDMMAFDIFDMGYAQVQVPILEVR